MAIKLPIKHRRETEVVLSEILLERIYQNRKWGEQNWPILDPKRLDHPGERMCEFFRIPKEKTIKQIVEMKARDGNLTYMEILIEEVSEAASCGKDVESLRKELIQVAAVAVAMIETIDRNGK